MVRKTARFEMRRYSARTVATIRALVWSGTVLAVLAMSSTATAINYCHDILFGTPVPDCVCPRCCDDYCAKPLPIARCVRQFCCSNYCAKPIPCSVPVKHYCCEKHCAKRLPCVVCPPGESLKFPLPQGPCSEAASVNAVDSAPVVERAPPRPQ